jgi:hypothetical protein
MTDRPAEQVIAERLAAHRNGLASDGRGWFRTAAEKTELTDLKLLTADAFSSGRSSRQPGEADDRT